MIHRTPTSGREGGVVEVARGRARRSCGILGGRLEAPGLWILPEAWKTPLHSRDTRALGARVSHPSVDGASAAHRLHRPSSLFVHVHHNE